MRSFLYIFLYLNIYIAFFSGLSAQEIQLTVKGESQSTSLTIDSINFKSTFANLLTLKKEADTIQSKLQRIGYIDSELQSVEKLNDSLYRANYNLGEKVPFIKIYYDTVEIDKNELSPFSNNVTDTYFIIPLTTVENTLQKLTVIKTNNGYAFASLRLIDLNREGNMLSASLLIRGGSVKTIDSITIKGYEKFSHSFLRYYAGVRIGQKFNQQQLVEQNEIINNLGFVRTLKAPEALFKKDSTTVYFYLEKQNNNLFDGILGFATDEQTHNVQFNGYLNLELNNNLNFGEQLLINYKADGNEQQNFRTKLTLPYLFKTPIGLGMELKIIKRDSTFVTTEQKIQVQYQINPSSILYGGYKGYESSNLLDEASVGSTVEDYNSKFLILGVSYSKQQSNNLFPLKTLLALDSEIGNRELKMEKEEQLRFSLTLSHIFNLNYRNSIFLRNNSSILISDSYLTNELFTFGGINSIRGFNENSIDASLFSVLNTEYRYQFNDGVYAHSIIDLGYFQNQILHIKEKLYSFGIGLGLQTSAGIFRMNIANGITENQDFNFSNTKIHISLSSRF